MKISIFEMKPAFAKVAKQAAAGLRDSCDKRFMQALPDLVEELAVLAWEPGPLDLDAEIEVYTAAAIILDGSARITEALDYRKFSECLEEEIRKALPEIDEVPEWVQRVLAAAHTDAIEGPIYRHREEIALIRAEKVEH